MTYIHTRTQRCIPFWITLPLLLIVLVASVQAADDFLATPVSDSGVMVGTALRATGATEGLMPFAGTGKPSGEAAAQPNAGWVPPRDEIRGLPPVSSGVGVESVLGTDTRFRVYTNSYPAQAIALITFDGGYCTGTFYGPNVLLTAGHCVHSGGKNGKWRTNVKVWPAYNAGIAPFGVFGAKWIASVFGWTLNGDERYDYGVIKLHFNVGNWVGWYGTWWQAASLKGETSIIAGYPSDKFPAKSMWISADEVRDSEDRQVFYKNDTFNGMSGSAVWNDRPAWSPFCADGPCIFAVHAYGLHGFAPHADNNHGTRINQPVFNNLVFWRNAP